MYATAVFTLLSTNLSLGVRFNSQPAAQTVIALSVSAEIVPGTTTSARFILFFLDFIF
jgi:hypothetical protein